MKKLIAAVAALMATTVVASAADLGGSVKDNGVGDAIRSTSSAKWTGVYVMGRIGGAINSHELKSSENVNSRCRVESDTMNMDIYGRDESFCSGEDATLHSGDYSEPVNSFTYTDAGTITGIVDSLSSSSLIGGGALGGRYQFGAFTVGGHVAYDFSGGTSKLDVDGHSLTIKDGNDISAIAELGYATGRALFHVDGGYGWSKAKYVGIGDADVNKHTAHPIVGGGMSYALTDHVSVDLSYQHWFASKQTLVDEKDFTLTDSKSIDRAILSVGYKF